MDPNESMESQKRLMLAVGLAFLVALVFAQLTPAPEVAEAPVAEEQRAEGGEGLGSPPGSSTEERERPGSAAPGEAPSGVAQEEAFSAPVREVTQRRPDLQLGWTSVGASLEQAVLLGEKMREQPRVSIREGFARFLGKEPELGERIDMAAARGGVPRPMTVTVEGEGRSIGPQARYEIVESSDRAIVFRTRGQGLEVEKRIEWLEGEQLGRMELRVRNLGEAPFEGDVSVFYGRGVEPGQEQKPSMMGAVGNESQATCAVGGDLEKRVPDDEETRTERFNGPIRFFGVDQQYFLGALFPWDGPIDGSCTAVAAPDGRWAEASFPLALAAGTQKTLRFGLYIGPKELDTLEALPERAQQVGAAAGVDESGWHSPYPHLDETVDFGFLAVICKLLLFGMRFFHDLTGNWGVAIILLTVLVKVILLPLTHKSMVAGEQMKKLQPKMEAIRKKFAQDRERMNMEVMKLYQEAKVNPLGGCLPLLVQLPVWIALYTTLRNSYELYQEPFISPVWIDLTYKDPTYLFPLLLGLTMFVTNKLQPQVMDPAQARLFTYVMPVIFTVVMLNYPAGLTLYIFTNNLVTIAQQYGLRRYLTAKGEIEPRKA